MCVDCRAAGERAWLGVVGGATNKGIEGGGMKEPWKGSPDGNCTGPSIPAPVRAERRQAIARVASLIGTKSGEHDSISNCFLNYCIFGRLFK